VNVTCQYSAISPRKISRPAVFFDAAKHNRQQSPLPLGSSEANTGRTWYAVRVPNLRKCTVTVKDIEGVVHVTTVTAESLNEAVGLAIAAFRKEPWASMLPEMSSARIEVQQPIVEHEVNLQAWWKWLDRTGVAPRVWFSGSASANC
jgi:hypothetical protein